MQHQVLACCVLVVAAMATSVAGSPLRDHFWKESHVLRESQACGDQLVNMVRLVCSSNGGYNVAFRPEHHRSRRGIVEECCYRSCTLKVIEQYCQGEPPERSEPSSVVESRKRSDESTELHTTEDIVYHAEEEASQNTITQEHSDQKETKYNTTPKTIKESKESYKLLNSFASSEHILKRNKLTLNDTTKGDFSRNKLPPLRHHRHHQRQPHGRKSSVKTKRDKSTNLKSFQIGTLKPYFVAHPVASSSL